ncbi:UNVERIFIED_CONTAM: HECT-domain (ubiquitin-transferase) domain-containing protein [Hammondia hammondi]|eukprot:XP_008886185.1 HECT-domain (ubiquitin-transferase) domain-containing protein [Hammondia hammondi]
MRLQPESAQATPGQVFFTTATCGENFSVLLSSTGVVFTCGDNSQGCLGLNASPSSSSSGSVPSSSGSAASSWSSAPDCGASASSLSLLSPLYAVPVRQVAAGAQHVVALTISGSVYTWGRNRDGRLGLGPSYAHARTVAVPTRVESLGRLGRRVKFVAAGFSHSAVLLTGGRLMTCGSNYYGELGWEPYYDSVRPESEKKLRQRKDLLLSSSTFLPLTALAKHRVKLVSLGHHFSAAVTASGKLFCWGRNDLRQLGLPSSSAGLLVSPSASDFAPATNAQAASELARDAGEAAQVAREPPEREHAVAAREATAFAPPGGGAAKAVTTASGVGGETERVEASKHTAESARCETVGAAEILHPPLPYSATPVEVPVENGELFFYFVACGDCHCGAAAVPASVAAAGRRGRDELRSSAVADLQPFFKSIFCRSQSLIGCDFPLHSISRGLSGLSHGASLPQVSLSRKESLPTPVSAALLSGSASLASVSFEESAPGASSSYLAGVSVEEVLMLIEGAQSTGDDSLLRSKLALVFSDVYRLNSSFVFPGRGCHPDFAGLDEVYVHLPEALLPVVAASLMTCLAGSVKFARQLKTADAVRFLLFGLACFRLYGQGLEEMAVDEVDLSSLSHSADRRDGRSSLPRGASARFCASPQEAPESTVTADAGQPAEGEEAKATAEKQAEEKARAGMDDTRGEAVFAAVAHLLFHLPPEGKMEFVKLAAEFPDNLFEQRLVRMTKWFITKTLRQARSAYRNVDRLWHGVALLELLYLANTRPSSHRTFLFSSASAPAASSETAHDACTARTRSSSSVFSSDPKTPREVKIPVEKFHLAAVAQLVDPIREVALYADLIQRGQTFPETPERRATPAEQPDSLEGQRANTRGGEKRNETEEDQEKTPQTGDRNEKVPTRDTPLSGQRRKREVWSTFDVFRDVIHSTELQSRWCFFMAHMQLCSLEFKRNVILVDNIYKQHHTGLQSLLEAQLPFLLLRVHRGALLDDAVAALQQANPQQLLRPLKIVFEGEEGVDEGGLKREFFSLLTPELLSPERGLFTYNPAARTYWFSGLSPEEIKEKEKYYWLIGALASMAIYNDMIMPLAFPLVLYNRLQGRSVSLEDLGDVFPEQMNSFEKMLTMDKRDEFEAAFSTQTFSVDLVRDDKVIGEVPLIEGGENIPVTMENRDLFVSKYTQYLLVDSVKQQYDAFETGFLLCSSPLTSQLSGLELQLLICGTPDLDFRQLRESAKVEGFDADDPYIDSFWKILSSFDIFQKQKFLKFVTGSDRAPAFGLKEIRMTVQKNGVEPTERLPTAYTCFSVLLLPRYASSEKLQRLLLRAIDESEGFGLQ